MMKSRLLESWLDDLGITEVSETLVNTAVNWVDFCHPREATREQRCLAEMYLLLIFSLDDYTGDDFLDMCRHYERGFSGSPLGLHDPVAGYVIRDFLRRTRASAGSEDLTRFVHEATRLVGAYRWRRRIKREGGTSVADYEANRYITINVLPYIELWEAILDKRSSDQDRAHPTLVDCTNHAIRFMYLSNDLFSVDKDLKVNDPNYAVLHASEHGVDIEAAVATTRQLRDDAIAAFRHTCEQAPSNPLNARQRWYVDFYADLVRAFEAAMEADDNRYS